MLGKAATSNSHDIAIGVIKNSRGAVLISKRKKQVCLGGLWELPGGKREVGETIGYALRRELKEELGIGVHRYRPLIKISIRKKTEISDEIVSRVVNQLN